MAGEHVHLFVRRLAETQQLLIHAATAVLPLRGLVHAVIAAEAVRKRGVHADDHRLYLRIGRIAGENAANPCHLREVEHVLRRIVHGDEIDAALNPVVIRSNNMIVCIVREPLPHDFRPREPVSELHHIVAARVLHHSE